MRVRRALTAVGAVMVLALAGCGGLPETGPVVAGMRLDAPIPPLIGVQALGPAPNASQQDIVRGFIRAAEDADEGRPTARRFLTPSSDARWRWADEDIMILDSVDNLSIVTVGPNKLQVRARAVAKVSPQGRYTDLPTGSQVTTTFYLEKDDGGEWRIELPTEGFGLWLDSESFRRLYSPADVYYVTRSGRQLVPDERWFPNGSRRATALARAQLDPVPPYLGGAVMTGVPAGTTLAVNAVPVENGRAQVTLSETALDADPDERTAMWAQLAATLSAISSVDRVSIKAGDTDLELPDLGAAVSAEQLDYSRVSSRYSDSALLRRKDGLISRVDPRSVTDPETDPNRRKPAAQLKDTDPVLIPNVWVRLALSVDESEVAAVGDDLKELALWHGSKLTRVPWFGSRLTRPTYDAQGFLWIGGVAADGTGRLFSMYADPKRTDVVPQPVSAPWLKGRRVVALAVAADSARMLVVTTDLRGGDAQLGVAGIVRAPTGAPTSVNAPMRLAQPLTSIEDVGWLQEGEYAVLGRIAPTDPLRAWRGEIGAGLVRRGESKAEELSQQPLPKGRPVSLISNGSFRDLVLISNLGTVWRRVGITWQAIGAGTDLLVPGR